MKILIIGAGGREHALCWKLAQSPEAPALYAAPGNPGIAALAQCTTTTNYLGLADSIQPDLTIVGPEAPLAEGIADRFRERNWPIIGPSASAARIESSKSFAKALMQDAGVATARHVTATSEQDGFAALKQFGMPVVLKADGLAAGKGVVIAQSEAEAHRALPTLFELAPKILIEEYLVPILVAAAHSEVQNSAVEWNPAPSVCVVLTAAGYPGEKRSGDVITGVNDVTRGVVFQAGTTMRDNTLVTSGGRVLGVTASGGSLHEAIENTYREVHKVQFPGMHYRTDIGHKGLKRW